jgi:hypothetical protein
VTHRTALALSIALTLILAVAILAGRDRFFAAEANAGPAGNQPAQLVSGASLPGAAEGDFSGDSPRVIEFPLPAVGQGQTQWQSGGEEQNARDSSEIRDRGSYRGEEEGAYDD